MKAYALLFSVFVFVGVCIEFIYSIYLRMMCTNLALAYRSRENNLCRAYYYDASNLSGIAALVYQK